MHDYVETAKEYIDMTYPDRHTLILGDSRDTLPIFLKNNENKKFDVIFIDGGHQYEIARSDIINCFALAHKDTIVIVNDTIFTKELELHFNIGPTKSWLEFKNQNIIQEIQQKEYSVGRGMSWGKYISINDKNITLKNDIHIFIFCYNERILLPQTIKHYRDRLPNSNIFILDNYSTDDSIQIAKTFRNVEIVMFDTKNITNEYIFTDLKNNCWKSVNSGWIIVVDMDEWLCIDEAMLEYELKKGTSILLTQGYNITSESLKDDLSDIDLHSLQKGVQYDMESKKLCFLKDKIFEINYDFGSHTCSPFGIVKYSKNIYINKHMVMLGLPYLENRYKLRFARAEEMRKKGMDTHYSDNSEKIKSIYQENIINTKQILSLYGDACSYTELCQIMEENGSDKGSTKQSKHNYTKVYYDLFSKNRYKNLKIFELGIGTNNVNLPSNMGADGIPGASLRGWKKFFPKSYIYGADIDKNVLFSEDRIDTFYCDQTNQQSISDLWSNEKLPQKFDIIIEDGLHTFDANVCFFENSIHRLNKEGYFIIEDIQGCYLDKMKEKCKKWNAQYLEIQAEVLEIKNPVNDYDNNIVLVQKIF